MLELVLENLNNTINLLADRCRQYREENEDLKSTVKTLEAQYAVARKEVQLLEEKMYNLHLLLDSNND